MTQRENLLSLVRRQGYEFVPVEFNLCPHLVETYKKEINSQKNYRDYFNMPFGYIDDLKLDYNEDTFKKYYENLPKESTIDIYGIAHISGSEESKHMTYMLNPLKNADSVNDILNFPYPDFTKASIIHLKTQVNEFHNSGIASCGNHQLSIWENAWFLRSMENLMIDMVVNPRMAEAVFELATEQTLIRAIEYSKAGVDIIFLGDDIGMQNSIMMNEDMYVAWIKPRIKKVIDAVKRINEDIVIFYHSCGYIIPFIPHLIEVGVDVLNPIQTECMDFEKIHSDFANDLSFYGTIGTQKLMPFGTEKEIKNEVFTNLEIAGKKGGLICSPTHLLEPEVPWGNIMAYVEACNDYKQ